MMIKLLTIYTLLAIAITLCALPCPADDSSLPGYIRTPSARLPGHDRKIVTNSTPSQCKSACDSENAFLCKSFDYNRLLEECILSDANANATTGPVSQYPASPFDYYERLNCTPAPELPVNLHTANPSSFRPSVYEDTRLVELYEMTPESAIDGHNLMHLSNVSPIDCMRACESVKSFECRSFDFHRGLDSCDLSNIQAGSEVELKTDYPGAPFDHYSRKQ